MKKTLSVAICLLLMITGSVNAGAAQVSYEKDMVETETKKDNIEIIPFWINTAQLTVVLSFDNSKGSLAGTVVGHPGTTEISVDGVLERQNSDGAYTHINTWNDIIADGSIWFWGTDYYVSRGYTYRWTLYATVYRNGTVETVSGSKSAYAG